MKEPLKEGNKMELKFRAWHKERKTYYNVEVIDFYNQEVTHIFDDYINQERSLEYFAFKDIILEQYTGLKDKNGNEIYVGDVFKIKHGYNWKKESHFEVVFSRNYGYILRNKDGDWFPLKDKCKSYEIIGNVHEIGENENV